jgi:F-type H+-transporting ATPase subunit b
LIANFTQFATAEPASGGLMGALGIDWKILILQIIAFLILVWLLGKYVYPWLMKSVDDRQAKIEAATKAASKTQAEALKSEERIEKLLKKAREDAASILETAKVEASNSQAAAEARAKKRAEQIVTDAQTEIQMEVESAKALLHNETLELVALATEKVIGKTMTGKIDETIISDAIKAVK